MKICFIYALIDPRDNKVRYIGKTNNVKQRLKNHLNPARFKNTNKFNWVKELRGLQLKPELFIIDEVLVEEWKFWEKYWIEQFLSWGFELTNQISSSNRLTFGNQTSFKKGHKVWLGKSHTEETKRKISKNSHWRDKATVNSKRVLQMDLNNNPIEEYRSARQAAELTNSLHSKICMVCNGKRNMHNNFKWKYL